MEHNIIREYPAIRYESRRYDVQDFEKYKEITKSIESYEKWKIGINYRTNRKITIGINNKNKDLYIFYRYEASLTSSAAPQHPFLFIFSLKKSNLMADSELSLE